MSTETGRQVIGATDKGEVTVITRDVLGAPLYIVRQGGHTVIETANERDALSLAKTLVAAGEIVQAGVDETRVSDAEPRRSRARTEESTKS